ncbi:galactose-specific lectin nattectin-like [Crassostrea angulata]|uniref:galactose-specific lectin nattectin-like n=1 Tax=Magallana angulata TaxID=2784310 RepID=UPI0022B0AC39|nr:galactose-specific lectin nattectin-like [Crassostrea angulata]
MFTYKHVFVFCVFCILAKICHSAMRTLQVEQIFDNKVVMDNFLAEYGHSTSALCSVVCQQETCECFGFNSITKTCRVHTFCRPDNTLIEESGWKYYRSRADWDTFMNSEYLLNDTVVTWSVAQTNCMIKGGKLAEIESPEENNYIMSLVMKLTENVWLGGTDQDKEGSWVWQSTKEPLSYKAWATGYGEPDDYNNQDCLCVYRPYGLNWSTCWCWILLQYICERELFN